MLARSFHGLRSLVAGTIVYDAGSRSGVARLAWSEPVTLIFAGLHSQSGFSCWTWSVAYGTSLDLVTAHGLFTSWSVS